MVILWLCLKNDLHWWNLNRLLLPSHHTFTSAFFKIFSLVYPLLQIPTIWLIPKLWLRGRWPEKGESWKLPCLMSSESHSFGTTGREHGICLSSAEKTKHSAEDMIYQASDYLSAVTKISWLGKYLNIVKLFLGMAVHENKLRNFTHTHTHTHTHTPGNHANYFLSLWFGDLGLIYKMIWMILIVSQIRGIPGQCPRTVVYLQRPMSCLIGPDFLNLEG